MQIQDYGPPGNSDLQRQNRESRPLGGFGNLHFKPQQGGAVGASRSGKWPHTEHFVSELLFAVSLESRGKRDLCRNTRTISENHRHISDLLSSMTAPFTDMQRSTEIARNLAIVSQLSQGDLANLRGGQEFLSAFLQGSTRLDLYVLREDVLSNEGTRAKILDKISCELRVQASAVLEQIRHAVDRDSVREPLWRLAALLGDEPVDVEKVYDTLLLLPYKACKLDNYFQSLPLDSSLALLNDLRPEKFEALERAVSLRSGNDPVPSWAKRRLLSLRQSCHREMATRTRLEKFAADPIACARERRPQTR